MLGKAGSDQWMKEAAALSILGSRQLTAFIAVVEQGGFARAAKSLHITQSALSQRIKGLEDDIMTTLFVRRPSGAMLTPAGETLLRYALMQKQVEQEFVNQIQSDLNRPTGRLRLAGFSSVMRTMVLPALEPLIRDHPQVHLEFCTDEVANLTKMLRQNQTDFVLSLEQSCDEGLTSELLGYEENVLVEADRGCLPERQQVYLDHDHHDRTTLNYFGGNLPAGARREFFGEIYAIMDATRLGFGRAVLSKHLIHHDDNLRILEGGKPLTSPVYLTFRQQPFYSLLHKLAYESISQHLKKNLRSPAGP